MGFFKSFFSGKPSSSEEELQKHRQKNFDIFKYDGMRAQRMGRADYAIKCFQEALALQEDFETMGYLVQVYTQTGQLDEARRLLERMTQLEPDHANTFLNLANVCFVQEDYPAMAEAARKAIAIEEGNAMAHYLQGKATDGQGDGIMCIAHLTKAILLKDDFMKKLTEAIALFDEAIELNPHFVQAYHERGRAKLLNGDKDGATEDMKKELELNPQESKAFNGEYNNRPGGRQTDILGL